MGTEGLFRAGSSLVLLKIHVHEQQVEAFKRFGCFCLKCSLYYYQDEFIYYYFYFILQKYT
jgi:hypothetical protein